MAIFEKTIQNKKFDQLLWKLENEIPASSCSGSWKTKFRPAAGRQSWKPEVISKRAMPGAASASLNGTA